MQFSLTIISGGQTGADRAALDFAIAHGIPHGGWCPLGRRAEDGVIPSRYQLWETPTDDYAQRTRWNVRDSDGTAVISIAPELSGGSLETFDYARDIGKPVLHVHAGLDNAAAALRAFLKRHAVAVLNLAGPRASGEPRVAQFVGEVLQRALSNQPDPSHDER